MSAGCLFPEGAVRQGILTSHAAYFLFLLEQELNILGVYHYLELPILWLFLAKLIDFIKGIIAFSMLSS